MGSTIKAPAMAGAAHLVATPGVAPQVAVDNEDAILPTPDGSTEPAELTVIATASMLLPILEEAAESVDKALEKGSLLTFGAECLAQIFELGGKAVRDLAKGGTKEQVIQDLDEAIADKIEELRFGPKPT